MEELIDLENDSTSKTNPLAYKFESISTIIEEYEETHFPIDLPGL